MKGKELFKLSHFLFHFPQSSLLTAGAGSCPGRGAGGLCREVMNMVDVAQAADPRPHDIHPLIPRGHDTGAKPSETRGEACDEWGSWALLGQDSHLMVCSLSPTLGHQPQVSVLELSVRAWGEGSVIPKPG